MAKKKSNLQDLFFDLRGEISFEDKFPHRGKEAVDAKGLFKLPEQKVPNGERSNKGFPNSLIIPIEIDKKKRDELEAKINTIGVFVDTDEGQVFFRTEELKHIKGENNG